MVVDVSRVLVRELDHIEWEERTDSEVAAELLRDRPLWIRISNFYWRNISLLRLLPPGQLILWKLEHWGADTPFERVPASLAWKSNRTRTRFSR